MSIPRFTRVSRNGREAPLLALFAVTAHTAERRVLNGVDLTVSRGEAVAVLGLDAAGGSQLCRIVNGSEHCDSGQVLVDGRPIPGGRHERELLRADLGLISPRHDPNPRMSVIESVTRGQIRTRGISPIRAFERARALMARAGVSGHDREDVAELSVSGRRRVQLARALALEPRLLLLDDVTRGLDAHTCRDVIDLVDGARTEGIALLVVTDDLRFVRATATRIVVLCGGLVVEDQAADDFFLHPVSVSAREIVAGLAAPGA
ncbi:ATP-binding cassette domain-containing protein [Mycetocola saprophilus]|uniref:ATP-binding cassette domain-containing protein n=1 Tax=Mycetocola saprophilus TaxID=76636 RepID=UPI003BF26DDB